jgi:cephalosporin-C deacetylase
MLVIPLIHQILTAILPKSALSTEQYMSSSRPTVSPDHVIIDKPEDFDRFWKGTLAALDGFERAFVKTLQNSRGSINHYAIDFNAWGNTAIFGYCLHWNDAQARPLLIYTHGYNGQCNIEWQWAEQGLNVFGFDTRGFGRSTIPIHKDGWILTGIESPDTSILRGAICDYIRATEIARLIAQSSVLRTLYYGRSFGGAMALMAEGLNQAADLLAVGAPTFGWMAGRRILTKLGSGDEINRYIRKHPEQDGKIMNTLSYFDTVNFAPLINKPTLIGIGQKDIVVPAETVHAICKQLHCPHVIREFPYGHSSQPEEQLWQNFDKEWQQMALTGQLATTVL